MKSVSMVVLIVALEISFLQVQKSYTCSSESNGARLAAAH